MLERVQEDQGERIMKKKWIGVLLAITLITVVLSLGDGIAQTSKESKSSVREPALIISAGQSADTQMVKVLMDKNKIVHQFSPLGGVEDLQKAKSLVIVIGGSTKGMGAAGIDADKEASRIEKILAKAKELKLPVIGVHIGGKARRGDLSDRFIKMVVPQSSYLIVVKEGDSDEIFSKAASKSKIPITLVNRIADAQEPLKSIFGK
jgi:hypothetical protein